MKLSSVFYLLLLLKLYGVLTYYRTFKFLCLNQSLLLCDNKSSIFLRFNPMSYKCAKNIDLDYYSLCELVIMGTLHLQHIPSQVQLVDIFTKSVSWGLYAFFRSKLRVYVIPSLSLRELQRIQVNQLLI